MVVVLIIALALAIFAYSLLLTSIDALERADVQDYRIKADTLVEGAIDEAAYAVKQNPSYIDVPDNPGILPEYAGGFSDLDIKKSLIGDSGTYHEERDVFPSEVGRVASTEYELTAYDTPDLYFIWGDTEDAEYEFIDEETYKRHFYDYHYNPYEQGSDIIISGSAEVNDNDNDHVFAFGERTYPSKITRFQTRQNDANEQNFNDPEPTFFESDHPYDPDTSTRFWTLTYKYDPLHPGRNITSIDLITQPGHVALGPTDIAYTTEWNGYAFEPPMASPPNYLVGPYINATNLFSDGLPSTTLRIGFLSDGADEDYGFKLDGLRYHFDSEAYPAIYETPHPYDHLPATPPMSPATQVVYSPTQLDPLTPGAANQLLRITFDWRFYLEPGDMLRLVNLAAPTLAGGIIADLTGSAGAGQTYEAQRDNVDVPLAIALLFYSDGNNNSSTNNYGYKVESMEYTDRYDNWVTVNDPLIQTPHLLDLGTFIDPFDPDELAMHNLVWQPHVPGGGTLDSWSVTFDEGCDLLALNNLDADVIRITTPGWDPFGGPFFSDVHYFVDPASANGVWIGLLTNYHHIAMLGSLSEYPCGTAPYIEVYSYFDDIGAYTNTADNWGFRINEISYQATGAADFANEAPTIAAAVSLGPDQAYANFSSGPDSRGEWWITEKDLMGTDVEMVGVHLNLDTFDLDPGDYLVFYDDAGNEIERVTYRSFNREGPEGSGPEGPGPDAGGPEDEDPDASGPSDSPGFDEGTIDLNKTRGWVLVPGKAAHIVLVGDGDDNGEHKGFEVDRTAWWSGTIVYDSTGPFEKLDNLPEDAADFEVGGNKSYRPIR